MSEEDKMGLNTKCQSSGSSWQAKQMMFGNYEKFEGDSQVELNPTQLSCTYPGSCMKEVSSVYAQVFPAKSTSSGSVFPLHCTSEGKTLGYLSKAGNLV